MEQEDLSVHLSSLPLSLSWLHSRHICPYGYPLRGMSRLAGTGRRHCLADAEVIMSNDRLGEVRFLTVAEVASIMRVSKMTVYRLVHSGELPAVRVGRSFRVHAKAVHDYLETSYFDAG